MWKQANDNKLQLWIHNISTLLLFSTLLITTRFCPLGSPYWRFSFYVYIFATLIPLFFSSLQKYVREQILLAVAVIVKRGTVDKSINCKSIFHEVGQLISSGNPTMVRRHVWLFILDTRDSITHQWLNSLLGSQGFLVSFSAQWEWQYLVAFWQNSICIQEKGAFHSISEPGWCLWYLELEGLRLQSLEWIKTFSLCTFTKCAEGP